MSDDRLRRGLIFLGYGLLFEGFLGFVLRLSTLWDVASRPEPIYLFMPTQALMPAIFGLITLVSVWNNRFIPGAARAGFSAVVALIICHFFTQFGSWGSISAILIFFPLGSLLFSTAVPLLWASALIRADHPEDAALQKFGRVGAGLVQLGFVLQFVAHVEWIRRFGVSGDFRSPYAAAYAVASTTEIVEHLLLLWASVESVRTAHELETVRTRAARIHRLMKAWLLVGLGSSLIYDLSNSLAGASSLVVEVLHSTLWQTVQLATTFALARGYLLQFGATDPPTARSGA